jgi:hypothetical protein
MKFLIKVKRENIVHICIDNTSMMRKAIDIIHNE